MVELVETLQFKALLALHRVRTFEASNRLREDRRGVTLVEYGLIVALIGVAAMAALKTLGTSVGDQLSNAADKIANP